MQYTPIPINNIATHIYNTYLEQFVAMHVAIVGYIYFKDLKWVALFSNHA